MLALWNILETKEENEENWQQSQANYDNIGVSSPLQGFPCVSILYL